MNKKKRWITTAAILAVFCAALGYYNFRHDSPDAEAGPEALPAPRQKNVLNVNGMVIRPQTLTDGITTIGNLLPDEEVDLSFETSGKIVEINFREGTAVRKGESLTACIDLAELWQQTTAQNELAAVKAQLAAAMAQLNSAEEVKL